MMPQELKYFLLLPILLVALNFLLTWAFLRQKISRSIRVSSRQVVSGLTTVVLLAVIAALFWQLSGKPEQTVEPGKKLLELKCLRCHSMAGAGAGFAPELENIQGLFSEKSELVNFLQAPSRYASGMPRQQIKEEEINAIAEYLWNSTAVGTKEAGAKTASVEKGRQTFQKYCQGCHAVDGEADKAGPRLSRVGERLSRQELIAKIHEPGKGQAGAMPKLPLTEQDVEAVASYLSSLNHR